MSLRLSLINIVSWNPARDKFSAWLSDGSVLVLKPEWPFQWQNFQTGVVYHSRARWLWMNSPGYPAEMVYADGASRQLPRSVASPSFVWTDATATIQRLGVASYYQAAVEDRTTDDVIALLASSDLGPRSWGTGRLYAGIEASPLSGAGLDAIEKLGDWVRLDGGCRLSIRKLGSHLPADNGLVRQFTDSRILVRQGGFWSVDDGPRPSKMTIQYPTGNPEPNAHENIQAYVRLILQQLHTIHSKGRFAPASICRQTASRATWISAMAAFSEYTRPYVKN